MKIPTPLPWAMVYGSDGRHLIFAEDGPVATVAVRLDADEQQANADLLLGAPALLEAAHVAESFLRHRTTESLGKAGTGALAVIRAAIAKAEGR